MSGQVGCEVFGDSDAAHPRSPSSVGDAESLVQIQMTHVSAWKKVEVRLGGKGYSRKLGCGAVRWAGWRGKKVGAHIVQKEGAAKVIVMSTMMCREVTDKCVWKGRERAGSEEDTEK